MNEEQSQSETPDRAIATFRTYLSGTWMYHLNDTELSYARSALIAYRADFAAQRKLRVAQINANLAASASEAAVRKYAAVRGQLGPTESNEDCVFRCAQEIDEALQAINNAVGVNDI